MKRHSLGSPLALFIVYLDTGDSAFLRTNLTLELIFMVPYISLSVFFFELGGHILNS